MASGTQVQQARLISISDMSMEQPAHVSPRSSVRSHHRDLPRLTNPGWSNPTSSIPGSKAGGTPDSEIGLASPTIATVRQYYLDIGLDMSLQFDPLLRQSPQEIPRRHSEFSPALLTSQMRAFNVSSPTSSSPSVGIADPIVPEFRERPSYGSSLSELARLSSVVSKKGSLQQDRLAQTIGKIPTEYTHFRLREWGPVYLGNVATADVFVRAMHLQKPHRGLSLDSGRSSEKLQNRISPTGFSSKEITVRARVHPKAKERKPFLIQRRFDIQAMQANSPGTNTNDSTIGNKQEQTVTSTDKSSGAYAHIRTARSKSISSVGTSDKVEEQEPRRNSSTNFPQISAVRQIMPIHVEYALHYLPVLAALMLSGHIRKGDVVDLPLPRPEAWRESVSHIYTGKGEVTTAMNENILYLAGRVN